MTAGDAPRLFVGGALAYSPGPDGARLDPASIPPPRRRAAHDRPPCGSPSAPVPAAELDGVAAEIRSGARVVAVSGPRGAATRLLRSLAARPPAGLADGVVCVDDPTDPAGFARAVWDALFTVDGVRYAPAPAQLLADLRDVRALVLVDGWEPAAGRLANLAAFVPESILVVAAGEAPPGDTAAVVALAPGEEPAAPRTGAAARGSIHDLALAGRIEAAHAAAEHAVAAATPATRPSALHERGTLAALLDRRDAAAADLAEAAALHDAAGNSTAAGLARHNLAVVAPEETAALPWLLAAALLILLAIGLASTAFRDSTIDFGDVRVGAEARRLEEVRNPTGDRLDVLMALPEPGAAPAFCLLFAAGTAHCGTGGEQGAAGGQVESPAPTCAVAERRDGAPVVSLPPGERCSFAIAFAPTSVAGFEGEVAFTIVAGSRRDATWRVDLRGRGLAGPAGTVPPTTPTVTAADQPPRLSPIPDQTVVAGRPLTIEVAANDPDRDPISLSATGLPGWAALVDGGDGTGAITGTPGDGDTGTTELRVTATANGLTDSQPLTITVEAADAPPELATLGSRTVRVGDEVAVPVVATDPDGDPITLTARNLPAWATLVDNGDGTGTVTGTPASGDTGTTQSRITATANGKADNEVLTLTVEAATDAPPNLTNVGSHTTGIGQALTVPLLATDPDGDAIVLTAEDLPAWATLTDNGDGTGTVTGTPGAGDTGTTQSRITATANGKSDTELITLIVIGEDDGTVDLPPGLANVGSHAVEVGQPLSVDLAATDPDGDPIALTAEDLPAWATLTDNGDGTGTVTGTPGDGDTGITQSRIIATANGLTDTELLTVTVEDPE